MCLSSHERHWKSCLSWYERDFLTMKDISSLSWYDKNSNRGINPIIVLLLLAMNYVTIINSTQPQPQPQQQLNRHSKGSKLSYCIDGLAIKFGEPHDFNQIKIEHL